MRSDSSGLADFDNVRLVPDPSFYKWDKSAKHTDAAKLARSVQETVPSFQGTKSTEETK